MMLKNKILSALGSVDETLYVDDVFSTYLYNGTGAAKTIINGVNLADRGGMVWIKPRNQTWYPHLIDTNRAEYYTLHTNVTDAQAFDNMLVTAFNTNGFTVGSGAGANGSNAIFTSWTFRKAPKFFDVVTYTGNGTTQNIAHSLGVVPGMVIVKCTSTSSNWAVHHRSHTSAAYYSKLNLTDAPVSDGAVWNSAAPTDAAFTVGSSALTNTNGAAYVAYLFAHDPSADGIIQCGGYYDADNSGVITLGWEPQYIIRKRIDYPGPWLVWDSMRGLVHGGNEYPLKANTTDTEIADGVYNGLDPMATGFTEPSLTGRSYIYLAIRRSNKPPSSGTDVFTPTVYTGTNTDNRFLNTGILTDMVWLRNRAGSGTGYEGFLVGDRLGGNTFLKTGSASGPTDISDGLDAQLASSSEYGNAFSSSAGIYIGNNTGTTVSNANINASTTSLGHIALAFKRAVGVFDVVRYVGDQVEGRRIPHNLVAIPELIFIKRNTTGSWVVFFGATNECLNLDQDLPKSDASYWNGTSPTKTTFTVSNETFVNGNPANSYVAYLFASKPGISKVGTYTGNGGSQTIDCGFTTGARFVLIKRTNATGNWYVFDSARGIVSGNDPHLCANATTAEDTTSDSVDPASSGFVVNQLAATNLNVTSANYLFLALA